MVRKSNIYFSVLLAALILCCSVGITINKMVCFSSGNISLSLAEFEDCCPPESENKTSIAKKCCAFTSAYLQVELPSQAIYHFVDAAPLLTTFISLLFPAVQKQLKKSLCIFAGNSPPLSGREIINSIRVFRI